MIVDWIDSRFDTVKSNGQDARVCCPFCDARTGRSDSGFHLYINLETPVAHCFRCEWSGHHLSLVMSVDGTNYAKALQEMEVPSPNVALFDKKSKFASPLGLVQGHRMSYAPSGFMPLEDSYAEERAVKKYLIRRKVPPQVMWEFFGWVPGTHRAWMLVDDNWWQGRSILNAEPKYISPPWPKGNSLWNAGAMGTHDKVVLCEGVFSAIAVGRHAMALCGKTMTKLQAERIVQTNPSALEIMLDADAIQFAHVMAEQLIRAGYEGELKIRYMESGDPADGKVGDLVAWDWSEHVRQRLFLGKF